VSIDNKLWEGCRVVPWPETSGLENGVHKSIHPRGADVEVPVLSAELQILKFYDLLKKTLAD
jgi:hypothetical protein